MTISSVSPTIAPLLQTALSINDQLNDLQRQLGSGQKADTYAGLGPQGGITVALNAQLAALSSFDDTMTNVGTTVSLQQSVLQQIAKVGSTVQAAAVQPKFAIDGTGQTTVQKTAQDQLNQILSALNSQGGNGYLFSGNALNQPSVDTADHILNGNGSQAGLKQVIAERNQADLGADGLGRLVIPPASGSIVSVNEDVAGSPFGLKLAGVNSTLSGATVTGPTGSPPNISVDLGATNPNNGETVTYTFTLPDGTSQTLSLQATTATPPGPNQFSIGATPADTAVNLQAALTAGVSQIGSTSLSAASAMAASNDFFDDPPLRVPGPSFATATSQVAGTSADTVSWYTGGNTTGSVRSTAVARIDPTTTVSYGAQANEQGIRWIVQNIAALAATSYSTTDPNASASYSALNSRVYQALGTPAGVQNITDIEASLANAQTAMKAAQSQHAQTSNTLTDMLQSIEGVDTTQIGAQILSLQTSLSASLSVTARLSQINLLTYLAPVSG
jgi:flagellin-like hook-associated protein FlgL